MPSVIAYANSTGYSRANIVYQPTKKPSMRSSLQTKILSICHKKIAQKSDNVGVSFYAFFANKNDDPDSLMEVATWWIQTHQLDHFEKAQKIIALIEREQHAQLA